MFFPEKSAELFSLKQDPYDDRQYSQQLGGWTTISKNMSVCMSENGVFFPDE